MVFSRPQCVRKAATTANAKLIAHKRHPAELALNANNEAQWKYNGNQEFVYRLKCEKYLYLPSALGLGIIPANAGSLNSWQSRLWYTESSPRTRGALTWVPDTRAESRIIPADAGSTVSHDPSGRTMSGSSPRMRGALLPALLHDLADRIIPADAGSTAFIGMDQGHVWDHPRGCGEQLRKMGFGLCVRGSSPRMQGAHRVVGLYCDRRRIIPADAGSTYARELSDAVNKDHPRGCEEHGPLSLLARACRGSSPRMRGAQATQTSTLITLRIIPADAGSTTPPSTTRTPNRDHPRGCGEHLLSHRH